MALIEFRISFNHDQISSHWFSSPGMSFDMTRFKSRHSPDSLNAAIGAQRFASCAKPKGATSQNLHHCLHRRLLSPDHPLETARRRTDAIGITSSATKSLISSRHPTGCSHNQMARRVGTRPGSTEPNTPEQNGKRERWWHTFDNCDPAAPIMMPYPTSSCDAILVGGVSRSMTTPKIISAELKPTGSPGRISPMIFHSTSRGTPDACHHTAIRDDLRSTDPALATPWQAPAVCVTGSRVAPPRTLNEASQTTLPSYRIVGSTPFHQIIQTKPNLTINRAIHKMTT
jgi:hypothetical protein